MRQGNDRKSFRPGEGQRGWIGVVLLDEKNWLKDIMLQ